jgi:hypothetical protein
LDALRAIGNDAFGVVCNGTNAQAWAEFLSELSIVAGLRHRNPLRLQP